MPKLLADEAGAAQGHKDKRSEEQDHSDAAEQRNSNRMVQSMAPAEQSIGRKWVESHYAVFRSLRAMRRNRPRAVYSPPTATIAATAAGSPKAGCQPAGARPQ